ncbi:MAG: class I SAM-dependent methyltransferase [bacterium]|nr:class I SAM-dependent methyltransferase [bacterium]
MHYQILTTHPSKDYELIDSGGGYKLERYGLYTLKRPDPEALWRPTLPSRVWDEADASFVRQGKKVIWQINRPLPEKWGVSFGGLRFYIKPTAFKHTGLFPEQESNWSWVREKIRKAKRPIAVLNLFAYTGGATLAALKAGATVCHVDASKKAVGWARENAELSGLSGKSVRWVVDDVLAFLTREVKRGHHYDGIVMDPPAFGYGPKDELWKIEDDFSKLVHAIDGALSKQPLFVLMSGYASGYSALTYENNLLPLVSRYGGTIERGELALEESKSKRLLPAGIFARWSSA